MRSTGSQIALWLIAALLAVIAARSWLPAGGTQAALAQGQPLTGARGIFAFTGQLGPEQYGLFMLDVDQGTVWCYEMTNAQGTRKLRLVAARSWVYDRYLQDYNSLKPDFRDVQELVAQQRARVPGATPEDPAPPAPGGGDGNP